MYLFTTFLLALVGFPLLQGFELAPSTEPVRYGSVDNDCRRKPTKPNSEWVCAAAHKLIWFRSMEEFTCEDNLRLGPLKEVEKERCQEQDRASKAPPHEGPFDVACKEMCNRDFMEEKRFCGLRGEPVGPRKIQLKDNEYVAGKFSWYRNECEMLCDGHGKDHTVIIMHRDFCMGLEDKSKKHE